MPKQNPLFTVGQFAELHKINKRTLMYYDDIGLFHPAVKKDNGYRYYTITQSPLLEMILTLRELDMSIDEIRLFLDHRSPETLAELLSSRAKEIDENIRRLKEIQVLLKNQSQALIAQEGLDLSSIEIVPKKQEYLAVVTQVIASDYENAFLPLVEQARHHSPHRMFNQSYGTMFDVKFLLDESQADFREYLFLKIDRPRSKKGLFVRPAGNYIRGYLKGPWELMPNLYEKIIAYADGHGLQLCGFSYETGVNEITVDRMEEYITQVEIRVEERD